MKFYFALQVRSKVFIIPAGFAVPSNLYIKAVPSGIGKNNEA